jgi:hypothetical protein
MMCVRQGTRALGVHHDGGQLHRLCRGHDRSVQLVKGVGAGGAKSGGEHISRRPWALTQQALPGYGPERRYCFNSFNPMLDKGCSQFWH